MQNLIFNTGAVPVTAQTYKEYLEGVDWVLTSEVVIAGIIIVMLVLILLILIFKGFGKAVSKKEQAPSQSSAPAPVPAAPSAPAAPAAAAAPSGVSADIVAAITAAIHTANGGRQVTIRSIRVKNVPGRNPWAAAAIAENTKPF